MKVNDSVSKNLAEQILALLPGTDCSGRGGCGKKTCAECAESIAETVDVTLCPACSQEIVDKISEIVGVDTREIEKKMAFIACAGKSAGNGEHFDNGHYTSCEAVIEEGFKRGQCTSGCLGAGSCISVCTFGAISFVDGRVTIDTEKCNGCGACAADGSCVQGIISMIPADTTKFIPCSSKKKDEFRVRKTCGYGCIGCGECELVCPEGAVKVIDNHAVIDYDKCVGCIACTISCRKKIIIDTAHDLAKEKEKVAFVKCVGGEKASRIYNDEGVKTCKEAVSRQDAREHGLCTNGCVGLGDCTKVCRFGAMQIVNGTAFVDIEKCVGCRDCIVECPRNMISLVDYKGAKMIPCRSADDHMDKTEICESACIGCETCKDNCPNGAIYMADAHAVIDTELCADCHICQYVCPRNIIKQRTVPEYLYLQNKILNMAKGEW